MARNESRAESIKRLRNTEIRKVKAGLKELGITVPDIEGPSEDDADLRNLQEWQAIGKAFDDRKTAAENSAQAGNSSDAPMGGFGVPVPDSKKAK